MPSDPSILIRGSSPSRFGPRSARDAAGTRPFEWAVANAALADPWQVREARRLVWASGRYDVGRLSDSQVLEIARRSVPNDRLVGWWGRARPVLAVGGTASKRQEPEPTALPETPHSGTEVNGTPQAEATTSPLAWIEVEVVDEEGNVYAGEPYRLCSSGGRRAEGQLDDQGRIRIEDVPSGTYRFDFPELVSAALDET